MRRGTDRGIAAGRRLSRVARLWTVAGASLLLLLGLMLGWQVLAETGGAADAAARTGAGASSGRAAPLDCPAWVAVNSPNAGSADNILEGAAAVSATDVWAAGYYSATNGLGQTLVEHWNGSAWSIVPSPNPGSGDNFLHMISARAADDVWAVGEYRPTPGANLQTLTMHWTGSSWTVVASPNGSGSVDNSLYGVTAIATNDVWATGFYTTSILPFRTLALHWNGTSWSLSTTPNPGVAAGLAGVTAVSAANVWAVGAYLDFSAALHPLTLHWTGSSWSQVTSPSNGTGAGLTEVAPLGASDIWASGVYSDSTRYLTMTQHWNGSAWSIVPSPNLGTGDNILGGLAARATNDVWVVGYGTVGGIASSLILHWDGSAWTQATSANPSNNDNELYGATLAGVDTWAVGSAGPEGTEQTLIERLSSAPCATATISVTSSPTSTPIAASPTLVPPSATTGAASPTATGVPATLTPTAPPGSTATATSTVCPIQFSDVPSTDPFYGYIRCLACRGIVSGYSTSPPCAVAPCFQTGANVTRGQMSKFVANAAGYADAIPSTQQTFSDVPSSNPFWIFVERAVAHGVISGYTTDPPCTTGVPCFLPGNAVTRGQTSKFVSQAANYQDPIPSGQQTFTDVPPNSTFWVYVERAVGHGVISGYTSSPPCTTGPPCFLSGNSVTRGQTSKFIANAFFPNCQTPIR